MKKNFKGVVIGIIIITFLFSSPALADSVTKKIDVLINNITLMVNGKKVEADNILYNGTTYVPLRPIAEMLDKNLSWDANTKTAGITNKPVVIVKKDDEGKIELVPLDKVKQQKTTEEIGEKISSLVKIEDYDKDGQLLGSGSGVFINNNGYIITNYHVISLGYELKVITGDTDHSKSYDNVEIINYDRFRDLALIKINTNSVGLPISDTKQNLGSDVILLSNPLGLTNVMTKGIVSSFRDVDGENYIQIDAAASPGSSGGALLNMNGEIIGIMDAQYTSGQNLNLAIPSIDLLTFLENSSEAKRKIKEIDFLGGKYIGEVENGKYNGYGKLMLDNGDMYEGDFVNGLKSGQGNYYFADGSHYKGQFSLDMMTGQGNMDYVNGDSYHGDFVNGLREGEGQIIYSNGEYYQGMFSNDIRDGFGQLWTFDNKIYIGIFKDDQYDNIGMIYDTKTTEVTAVRSFVNGKIIGQYAKFDKDGNGHIYKKVNGNEIRIR